MEPLYFFQNFELENNTIIKQRFPQSTMPESNEIGLNVEAFSVNTFFSTGDIYSTPNDVTSLDIVMDVEYLPVPAQTNTTIYHYMFGLYVYRGLRFLTPTEYTNLGIDPTFGESPTPRRVVMQLYIRKVNDAYFLTKLIDGQVAYENARITRNPFVATAHAGRLTLANALAPRDLLRVYKLAIVANHDKMMRYDTMEVEVKPFTVDGQEFDYTEATLEESVNNASLQEEKYAWSDKPYATLNVGYEEGDLPVILKGAGFGNVPGFYSVGTETPQYVESLQAIPSSLKGKKVAVEVARPMVLRFAPGSGAVTLNKLTSGYNFQTQTIGTPPNYIIYNPETGATVTQSGTTNATITSVIGNDGGIVHIYPNGSYNVLTNRLTIVDSTNRLVEIVDYGTVCRYVISNNGALSTNLTKLPSYLPMVTNSLTNTIYYTAITSSEDIQHWDTSRVTDFDSCFYGKTLDFIPNWDYSSATALNSLLRVTCDAEQILTINAPNAASLASLANGANLPNISLEINAPKASNLNIAFRDSVVKSVDLTLRDVTSMTNMFQGTTGIESLTFRNTKFLNLIDVRFFAYNNTNFNFDLSNWCVPFATTTTDFDAGATTWLPENKPSWGNVSCIWGE